MSYKNALAFYLIKQSCKRNETEKKIEKKGERKAYLAPHPAHLPAQPSCRSSELLGSTRQAGRCSTATAQRATQLPAALLPPLAVLEGWIGRTRRPRPRRHLPLSPAPLPRSPRAMADAVVPAPS